MSKILKPRRGSASTMSGPKANTVLAAGEIFFETPNGGVGSGHGPGIKMGDGITAYSSLPYYMEPTNLATETIEVVANTKTTSTAALNDVSSGNTIGSLVGSLKQAISLTKSELTSSIDDLGTTRSSKLQFPVVMNNNSFGYMNGETFVAFRGDSTATYTYAANSTGGTVDMGARNNYRYVNAANVYAKGKSDGTTTHTGTFAANSRGSALDMGVNHSYRYVNTNNVPNTNSETYTYPTNSTGGTVDMGTTNIYRYVNASNVYNKGKADGVTVHTTTYTYPANDTGGNKDLGINHTYRYVNASNVYAKGKADYQGYATTTTWDLTVSSTTKTVSLTGYTNYKNISASNIKVGFITATYYSNGTGSVSVKSYTASNGSLVLQASISAASDWIANTTILIAVVI